MSETVARPAVRTDMLLTVAVIDDGGINRWVTRVVGALLILPRCT